MYTKYLWNYCISFSESLYSFVEGESVQYMGNVLYSRCSNLTDQRSGIWFPAKADIFLFCTVVSTPAVIQTGAWPHSQKAKHSRLHLALQVKSYWGYICTVDCSTNPSSALCSLSSRLDSWYKWWHAPSLAEMWLNGGHSCIKTVNSLVPRVITSYQ